MTFSHDALIFGPADVDLAQSPLAGKVDAETYVLGAFNPGMTRLPNGNLLLMVRVAEALRTPMAEQHINALRWFDGGYCLDAWPLDFVDTSDPRKFMMRGGGWRVKGGGRGGRPGASRAPAGPASFRSRTRRLLAVLSRAYRPFLTFFLFFFLAGTGPRTPAPLGPGRACAAGGPGA